MLFESTSTTPRPIHARSDPSQWPLYTGLLPPEPSSPGNPLGRREWPRHCILSEAHAWETLKNFPDPRRPRAIPQSLVRFWLRNFDSNGYIIDSRLTEGLSRKDLPIRAKHPTKKTIRWILTRLANMDQHNEKRVKPDEVETLDLTGETTGPAIKPAGKYPTRTTYTASLETDEDASTINQTRYTTYSPLSLPSRDGSSPSLSGFEHLTSTTPTKQPPSLKRRRTDTLSSDPPTKKPRPTPHTDTDTDAPLTIPTLLNTLAHTSTSLAKADRRNARLKVLQAPVTRAAAKLLVWVLDMYRASKEMGRKDPAVRRYLLGIKADLGDDVWERLRGLGAELREEE